MQSHVWNLRSSRSFRRIKDCFEKSRGRFGARLIQFSVLGNHLHLIVEAEDSTALSRGIQGLCVRIAKALNRMMKSAGRVFADHYHSRLLRSPTELVNAIAYVLGNAQHHYGHKGIDPYSSSAPEGRAVVAPARSWLLTAGWRRARIGPEARRRLASWFAGEPLDATRAS